MTKPGQPAAAAIQQVLGELDPQLRLVRAAPLEGGASAQVTAIDAVGPDGRMCNLVLRQYGPANLRTDPQSAAHEHHLLTLLHQAGLPVPRPWHADESGTILPGPYLVAGYIDGEPGNTPRLIATPPPAFTRQLAVALASLHKVGVRPADAPFLTAIADTASHLMGTCPTHLDEALNEAAVRGALARMGPPPSVNDGVILHGDYWPGNTLWRDGMLVGLIDWEDAQTGDPLADLANARMELCMLFSLAISDEFTSDYLALMPGLDLRALPYWDLYAGLRHAGRMGEWGLSPAELIRLQAGHREFTERALTRL
ncbi:MAG TPA: phosphotransferase [Streptosporangiaceae bacterium]